MFYINKEHGIIIHITSLTNSEELGSWLDQYHTEISNDIESYGWEDSDIEIGENEIIFSGDIGLFILERIKSERLYPSIGELLTKEEYKKAILL
jgi:hypothetical protein